MIIRRKISFPQQREFGVINEMRRHGPKRVYKKYIGRARKFVGDKIAKRIRKDIIDNQRAGNRMELKSNTIISPTLSSKITKEAEKRNIGIVNDNRLENLVHEAREEFKPINKKTKPRKRDYIVDSKQVSGLLDHEKYRRKDPGVVDMVKTRDKVINLKGTEGVNPQIAAHEAGHPLSERTFKGWIISRLSKFFERRNKRTLFKNDYKGSFIPWKDEVGGSLLVSKEKNAWDSAEDLMKKVGATPEEMRKTRNTREAAIDTYRTSKRARVKESLLKKIQIPSRVNMRTVYPNSKTKKRLRKRKK